jgi:hypothetical protein
VLSSAVSCRRRAAPKARPNSLRTTRFYSRSAIRARGPCFFWGELSHRRRSDARACTVSCLARPADARPWRIEQAMAIDTERVLRQAAWILCATSISTAAGCGDSDKDETVSGSEEPLTRLAWSAKTRSA